MQQTKEILRRPLLNQALYDYNHVLRISIQLST